jgi:hypothetical protein
MVRAAGPERRTIPMPPLPGGVEIATMVSLSIISALLVVLMPQAFGELSLYRVSLVVQVGSMEFQVAAFWWGEFVYLRGHRYHTWLQV